MSNFKLGLIALLTMLAAYATGAFIASAVARGNLGMAIIALGMTSGLVGLVLLIRREDQK